MIVMPVKIMDESEKNLKKVDKNILDLLWKLTNNKSNSRIDTCADILKTLQRKQNEEKNDLTSKDLEYTVERLVKGLASSRDAARLGFALLLTEILKQIDVVTIEDVLELVKKHLLFSTKQEKRDIIFGQLFAYSAIVRSGGLADHSHLSFVILGLYDLWQGRSYILNASYEILVNLFSQLSKEKFQENVWPHLKTKLSCGWDKSSADSLWLLLLCQRMFPDAVTAKYLRKKWDFDDLFSSENLEHHKKIIRQTTACLPVLHPLCIEFLAIVKSRKDMKAIWTAVVDENLFETDHTEKAYVGFEMVKKMLEDVPKKKVIECVLSPKFRTMFTRSFLIPKHPMNPAASHLTGFLSEFVTQNNDPKVQIIILKVFLQPPGSILSDQILKRKEITAIIQNLLPDAVKLYCEFLKSVATCKIKNEDETESSVNNKRFQAINQIGTLVCHPMIITDVEWRVDVIKFLFLHSFFNLNASAQDQLLDGEIGNGFVPKVVKESFTNAFYRAVNSLYHRSDSHTAPLEQLLQHLLSLIEYADELMAATDLASPCFPLDKVQESWQHMKSIVHKLGKQSKKDGKTNESNAFQALFLELAFHLFRDSEHISEVLEELHICCKKALHVRKHSEEGTSEDDEPSWVGVVVDILLSLLSRSSQHLRCIVASVFPLLCPFITKEALQQILDVINPEKAEDDPMLVDESEGESDVEFDSGSSSDESDPDEQDLPKVDDQFKRKVKAALGHAAEISDADSVVLSDSEMFKLDDKLAEAFQSRVQTGHTQLSFKDKAMLHFRVRCLDLVMAYLKSEPPMHLVLQCVQPVLSAYEYGHKAQHQTQLLNKAVSTLQILTRIKKFQHQDNVDKSEIKEILESLISKCHKETDMAVAKKLYTVCVFLVLCFRRREAQKSPGKKSKKVSTYMKIYLSALEAFAKENSSNMFPQFFVTLMEACPDLASNFIGPCQEYAFEKDVRVYKRTQCLGLIFEALKFSKGQSSVSMETWTEIGNSLIPTAVETLKEVLGSSSIKPTYLTELLDVIFTSNSILKEKTNKSLLLKHTDLLPLLTDLNKDQLKKLTKKGNGVRRRLILALGGTITQTLKKSSVDIANGTEVNHTEDPETVKEELHSEDSLPSTEAKQKKRKSKSPIGKRKKIKVETVKFELDLSDSS